MFDDKIADIESNKELSPELFLRILRITELFLRGRKLNISLAFISQSYFKVPKAIRLNATHYFIMKIPKNENLSKQHLILHLTLILKIS